MTLRRYIPLILSLLLTLSLQAQETMPYHWQSYLEQLSEDGEDDAVEELLEIYETFKDSHANLNDTNNLLHGFPFVSDIQRQCLKAYIILYGNLLSVEELYTINGFDSTTIEMLRPLVDAYPPESSEPLSLKKILTYGHHNFVTGIGGTIEQARGYTDSIYEGNNLRLLWRYKFKYKDRIQLQLSGDKDPGEAFFTGSQRQGFDFYGYNLIINDIGKHSREGKQRKRYIQRIVLGQYHAQFGQGLTLGSGFGSRMSWSTNYYCQQQEIRPNGVFTEYGYLRGGATTMVLAPQWKLTVVYSYTQRDATLPRKAATDSSINWVQSLYNSGYHRTQTEIGKQNQLGENLWAGHLEYHRNNLKAGITLTGLQLQKEIIPAQYVYNDNAFHGYRNLNAGIDATWRYHRLLLYGESALCANYATPDSSLNISGATLVGAEFIFNNNHRLNALARYYSPYYHNLHANSQGQSSTPQNETGLRIGYQGSLPKSVSLHATADFFYFPHPKYLIYAPSHGQEHNLMLSKSSRRVEGLTYNIRYRYKDKGRNITPSTMVDGQYLIEQTYRHQIQCDVSFSATNWQYATRLAYAHYHGDVTEAVEGLMFYQDIQYHPSQIPLVVATRFALFNIDDYEARLYMVESNFIYQSNTTMCQHKGCRGYLILRYNVGEHFNIGLKYGITAYFDQETFGSSYDQIDSPHRQQWHIQMRLKW